MKVQLTAGNGLGAFEILLPEGQMSFMTGRPFTYHHNKEKPITNMISAEFSIERNT